VVDDLRFFTSEGKARISRERLAGSKRTGFASKIRHARVTMEKQARSRLPGYIAFAIHRRNKALTAFVCHTLSNLRFDKAGAWLAWLNRGTDAPNESWFRAACSGKAQ
jgi:hypothetical protein